MQVLNRGLDILEISFQPRVNFNRSIQRINLVGRKIGDSETREDSGGMDHFPVGSIIGPGQVVVIANQGLLFSQVFGFQPDYELLDSDRTIPGMVKYGSQYSGDSTINQYTNPSFPIIYTRQDQP